MNLGSQVISVLGAHGLRGMFFDFKGYCALRRVRIIEDLRTFLDSRGFKNVVASPNVAQVVAELRRESGEESCAAWLLMEPMFWISVALGLGAK